MLGTADQFQLSWGLVRFEAEWLVTSAPVMCSVARTRWLWALLFVGIDLHRRQQLQAWPAPQNFIYPSSSSTSKCFPAIMNQDGAEPKTWEQMGSAIRHW